MTNHLKSCSNSSTYSHCDVLVAGAGIGGICVALNLARKGYQVVLIEPKPAGSFRLGESLDWEAPLFFKKLGFSLKKWIQEEKATAKQGAIVSSTASSSLLQIGFGFPYGLLQSLVGRNFPTIHLNREAVDEDFRAALAQAGVNVLKDKIQNLDFTEDQQGIEQVHLKSGRVCAARFYVDATGRHALIRKRFNPAEEFIGARKIAIRARFPHEYKELGTRIRTDDSLQDPSWIWDIHTRSDETDIGLVLTERDFKALHQTYPTLNILFRSQVEKHPDLEWLLPLIQPETLLWTCAFQDKIAKQSAGKNWIAVGDSAFVVDAILSSGVTTALRTGFLASKILLKSLVSSGNINLSEKWREIYHEKTAAQVRTVNHLIEVLWYQGRIREHYSFQLNLFSILVVNFNLNHFHTRYLPHTLWEVNLLKNLHLGLDRIISGYQTLLLKLKSRSIAKSQTKTATLR